MPRSFVLLFLFGLSAGLAIGEFYHVQNIVWWAATAVAVAALPYRRSRPVAAVIIGVALGALSFTRATTPAVNDISRLINRSVTLTGLVVQPSTISGTAQDVELTNARWNQQPLSGKLLLKTSAYMNAPPGSVLTVACTLNDLTPRTKIRWWSHGVRARCNSIDVQRAPQSVRTVRTVLGVWQAKLLTYVRRQYSEPQASLLNGIIVGNTDGMPSELYQAFQTTGTTHIVALSGFNVTIIVSAVMIWCVRLVGRRYAWIPSMVLVIVFVVMSGASSSVVRAAVMAVIVQLGLFLGRPVSMVRLMAYTAIVMLIDNPLLLFHDLGFQLSFLATIGLVFLSKPLAGRLSFMPDWFGLRENFGTTLGAMIMTEPLLLWRFGRLSLVAPVVNVIVLPLIPLSMAIGTASLLGMFIPAVASVLVPVSDALLRLILYLITFGAGLPSAMVYLQLPMTIGLGAGCVILAIILSRRDVQETHPA